MKKIYSNSILLFLLVFTINSFATPVKQGIQRTFIQPSGDTLLLVLNGDEHFHYWSTADGIPVVESTDGFCYYAESIHDIQLISGIQVAHNPEYRSASEINYLDQIAFSVKRTSQKSHLKSGIFDASVPTTGTLKGLVILAQFADREFTDICTIEQMTSQLNDSGYADYGMTGSARDYFIDQSQGLFTPSFDVVGPVTVSHDLSYYGENNSSAYDIRLSSFIQEACQLADSQGVNFSDYDNNKDGVADLVYVIYAGYAESSGAPSYTIWPQMWFMNESGVYLKLDSVSINCFACSSELSGISGKQLAGIGPFCHEFSHTLGLADIYNYNSKLSTGTWNIMDIGLYNNSSCTPAGYTSFEKMSLGWIEPTELTDAATDLKLKPLGDFNEAFKLTSTNNEDEFFLFENRQSTSKWDQYIEGHGMLILHVNYDKDVWNENEVNSDADNMRMHIIPANNNYTSGTNYASVPFPGYNENTYFSSLSTPSSTFSDGLVIDKPVTNIHEDGDTIIFDFSQQLLAPIALEATNMTQTSFQANWESSENAVKYTLILVNQLTGTEKTISNITKTRFVFDNLDSTSTYTYKVKAIGDELSSPFSNEITVNLNFTEIAYENQNEFSISYINHTVFIHSKYSSQIFDLLGRKVYDLSSIEAENGVSIKTGIYIIRSGNSTKKVNIF